MIFQYKHQIVRDLAWAISSPPIIEPSEGNCIWYRHDWYRELYESSTDLFLELDNEPEELESALSKQKDRRLGKRFEMLWAFWLERSQRYEIVAQNMPLRHGDKTLGELDFLVIDKDTGKYLHWEMAVKFYLGVNDTTIHRNWHGPVQKKLGTGDRLDKKVEHLKYKQSVICEQAIVRDLLDEMKIQVDGCAVVLKGRLFYPNKTVVAEQYPVDANYEHLRGLWMTMREFIDSDSDNAHFIALIGHGWLANIDHVNMGHGLSKKELLEVIISGGLRLPVYVASSTSKGGIERFFLVSDDWSADF